MPIDDALGELTIIPKDYDFYAIILAEGTHVQEAVWRDPLYYIGECTYEKDEVVLEGIFVEEYLVEEKGDIIRDKFFEPNETQITKMSVMNEAKINGQKGTYHISFDKEVDVIKLKDGDIRLFEDFLESNSNDFLEYAKSYLREMKKSAN
jgi:hypothetical protein